MRVVLASASPRRRDLLEQAGVRFEVVPASVDETLAGEAACSPCEAARLLARRKAAEGVRSCRERMADRSGSGPRPERTAVIGADTMVVLDGRIFGKPADVADAASMLGELAGRAHQVITGVSVQVLSPDGCGGAEVEETTFACTSTVVFKELSEEDISCYLACGESMDKAGAYAIQGNGSRLVERYEGDFDNIVGLPVKRLLEECPWLA